MKNQNINDNYCLLRISTRIFPDKGGPAKQAYILSNYLSKNNFRVFNLSCNPYIDRKPSRELINKNNYNFYLPFNAPKDNAKFTSLIIFLIKFIIISLFKAFKIIIKYKINIIHIHSPFPSGIIALLLSKMFKIPYFYTIHGLDHKKINTFKFNIKYLVKNSKLTFVVRKDIKELLENKYKLKNVYFLPNSIDQTQYYHQKSENEKFNCIKRLNLDFCLAKDDFIIVYIGYMFIFQKVLGMLDFLEAFSRFLELSKKKNQYPHKIKLCYIGEGNYSYFLEEKIKKLGLSTNAFFLGKRNDINEILSIADLLVLTSYIEGFPNVILEAMASSVPCLATKVGQIPDILDKSGFLVNPKDIDGIIKSLKSYYKMKNIEKQKLIDSAKKRVINLFDVNNIGKKIIKIYHKFNSY